MIALIKCLSITKKGHNKTFKGKLIKWTPSGEEGHHKSSFFITMALFLDCYFGKPCIPVHVHLFIINLVLRQVWVGGGV